MLHFFKFKDLNFLGFTKITTIISILLIVGSFVTLVARGKSAFGVDFTGGNALTFNYEKEINPSEIANALETGGFTDVRVSYKSSASQDTRLVEIVLSQTFSEDKNLKSEIEKVLNEKFPDANYSKGTTKSIGGLVGKRFTKQAIWAMFWGLFVHCHLYYFSV